MSPSTLPLTELGFTFNIADRTKHSLGAESRPPRTGMRGIIIHRIGSAEGSKEGEGRTVEEIEKFFVTDPEGVATTLLAGDWASKLQTIMKWRKRGIPVELIGRSFVPYSFLIGDDGTAYQMLPLDRMGAHAVNYNQSGMGIAMISDPRIAAPSDAQIQSCKELIIALLKGFGLKPDRGNGAGVKIAGHDEVRDTPKQCPGPLCPLDNIKKVVLNAFA